MDEDINLSITESEDVSFIITESTGIHSGLLGLDSDDHSQYILVDGSRGFTSPISGIAPIADLDLATKKYVDDTELLGVSSVAAGAGLNFTTITSTGDIILGTPSEITDDTTNSVSATSHTHVLNSATITANTAYRNIGHLPLTGGIIDGNLVINTTNPALKPLTINSDSANGSRIRQTESLANGQNALLIDSSSSVTHASNAALFKVSQGSASSNNTAMQIYNAGSNSALQILEGGTGHALEITQNGNGIAFDIDSRATSTSNFGLNIVTGYGANIAKLQAGNFYTQFNDLANTNGSMHVYRNDTSTSTNTPVVFIEQDNIGDDQNALKIQQDGTGVGIFINQDGNGRSLHIDSEATTANVVRVETVATTGYVNYTLGGGSEATSRNMFYIYENSANATGDTVVIHNAGTGDGLYINQDGNAPALNIDHEGTSNQAMYINSVTSAAKFEIQSGSSSSGVVVQNAGTGNGLLIDHNNTAGKALNVNSTATTDYAAVFYKYNADTVGVAHFQQDSTTSTGAVIRVTNDGTGAGLEIDQNNVGRTIFAHQDIGGANTDYVDFGRPALFGIASNYFYRNLTSAVTGSPVVKIKQDNASDDQDTLRVENDGTGNGLLIDQNGNGVGLRIDSEATSASSYGLHVQSAGGHRAAYIEQAGDNIALYINPSGVLTESAFRMYSNALHTGTSTSALVNFQQANTSATGDVMSIQNNGAGNGIYIDQNGAGTALNVDYDGGDGIYPVVISSNSTDTPAIAITGGAGGVGKTGLYESGGDLYWCRNGVSTKLN